MSETSAQSQAVGNPGNGFALPVTLAIVTLFVMVAFQSSQLWRERQALELAIQNQAEALVESERVQTQFKAIASGTADLASKGNQNALGIVTALQKSGVNFQNNAEQP